MTRVEAVLDLVKAIAERHLITSAGHIDLIAVAVDELDPVLDFLEPLCRAVGGRVFDCRDTGLDHPIAGTADPVLRAAVEAELQDPTGRRVVIQDLGAGMLDVAWVPPAGPIPSPGERTILALARAVLHPDWDTHEFVLIAYPGSVIDVTMRDQAWNLGAKHLAGMPHRTTRTVVYLVETGLQVRTHGHVDSGFALALEGPRLLRRTGRDTLNGWATALAKEPLGLVLFLAAGFSASSRLPLGNGLRDTAIKRLLGIDAAALVDSLELAKRFHAWVRPKSGWLTSAEALLSEDDFAEQLTLEQVIRAEARVFRELPTLQAFKAHHDAVITVPGPAILDLVEILKTAAARKLILTGVNFDQLVERHATVPLRVFTSEANFTDAGNYIAEYLAGRATDIPYLKFHGSIENISSCVVSAEQTDVGLGPNKLAALRSLFPSDPAAHRRWVYIGASMRDRDLSRSFQDADFSNQTDEVWVAPWLVDTVEQYMHSREPFWVNRSERTGNDRLICATADEFLGALRNAWDSP